MAVNLVVDGYVNGKRLVYTALMNSATSPAITLKESDSGCTVMVGQSTAAAVNDETNSILLPAPVASFRCEIMFTAVGDNTAGHNIQIQSTGANMLGNTVGVGAGLVGVNRAASTVLTRSGVAANALPGDYVKIWSDGTNYYFYAFSTGTASPWAVA